VPASGGVAAPASGRWLFMLLGGYSQRGRWRLSGRTRIVSLLGGAELDLRQAIVDGDDVSLMRVRPRRRQADRA
jgi:hypothetical protein